MDVPASHTSSADVKDGGALAARWLTRGPCGSLVQATAGGLTEMILGADFFASHRVLISPSHRAVYFTYEGGPVFQKAPPAPPAS